MKAILILVVLVLLGFGMGWFVLHRQGNSTMLEIREDRIELDAKRASNAVENAADRVGSTLRDPPVERVPAPVDAR